MAKLLSYEYGDFPQAVYSIENAPWLPANIRKNMVKIGWEMPAILPSEMHTKTGTYRLKWYTDDYFMRVGVCGISQGEAQEPGILSELQLAYELVAGKLANFYTMYLICTTGI